MPHSAESQARIGTLQVWLAAFAVTALAVLAYRTVPLGLLPTSSATRMLFSPMALLLVPLFVVVLAFAGVAFWLVGTYTSARVPRILWTIAVVVAAPATVYALMAGQGAGFSLRDLLQPTVLLLLGFPLLGAAVYSLRASRRGLLRVLGVQALAFGAGMALYVACVILLGTEA